MDGSTEEPIGRNHPAAYIDKADGKQRPLAIAALEDKIVQGATVIVLNAIYEGDFVGFSYGFRPGRGPHDAFGRRPVCASQKLAGKGRVSGLVSLILS